MVFGYIPKLSYAYISLAKNIVYYGAYLDVRALK